ncbi:hypothetical protein BS50DRAFT_668106 [Corynespora cassiicola Philippines]|uniref:Uncharacterized protein n=1 Tax=Corynespora cassiicola Philippines TaxID=1448308 RepID=A0A2T2N0Z7_CORCC|nr:hypothetical protein BS50DRAFT_668106 [Corynespora cassiicola Philippines]
MPQTSSTKQEIEAPSSPIRDKVRRHRSSSPASIVEVLDQFRKGAKSMLRSQALFTNRAAELEGKRGCVATREPQKKADFKKRKTLGSTSRRIGRAPRRPLE